MGFGPEEVFTIDCELETELYDGDVGGVKEQYWKCDITGPDLETDVNASGFELSRGAVKSVDTDMSPRRGDPSFVAHLDQGVECAVESIESRNQMWCRKR